MTGRAAEIHQPALRQQVDAAAVGERELIVLRLDRDAALAGGLVEAVDLDLVVEVADVTDDRLVLHPLHVLEGDDVACCPSW
jgi:hypothetical protein